MPLLTTQSAKGFGFGAASAVVAGDFESISTQIVTTNTATITLSSIPSTYVNLQLRIFAKKDTGGNDAYLLYFNNDTTNGNYAYHNMGGDGTSFTQSLISRADMGSVRDNAWNTTVVDIVDYLNTSNKKVRRAVTASMGTTDGSVFYYGGVWNNTAAVNRIDLKTVGGNSFIPGSVFALYGLKG
jgi:hypothetical protein